MGKMKDREQLELIKSYAFRLKAFGINFEYGKFKNVFSKFPSNEINNKLSSLMNDKDNTIIYLNQLGIKAIDKYNINNLTEKVKKQLNLSDVIEFTSNDKDYFKFRSNDGQIFIVRNLGNDSKQLFMNILKASSINFDDGKKNADLIFRRLNDKKFIEIQMEKSDEIRNEQKDAAKMAIIKKLEQRFPDKQIIASLEESIYIIKGNNSEEDIVLSANYENGKFKIRKVTQKTYGKKVESEEKPDKKEETNDVEVPKDILEEIENDIDLHKIIEEGIENNLDDQTIESVATNTLINKNSKFTNINVAFIINRMIALARQRRQSNSQNTNSLGGRQYTLNTNSRINLFDNAS